MSEHRLERIHRWPGARLSVELVFVLPGRVLLARVPIAAGGKRSGWAGSVIQVDAGIVSM